MKIYRVDTDVNRYQYLMLEDQSLALSEPMTFDGTPGKASGWTPPAVYIHKPKLIKGNFLDLWATGGLVVDEVALDHLRDLLEMSGELLPLPHKNETFHVLNVTDCVNMLDEKRTRWRYGKGRLPIDEYQFHADRITEAPLFKIPETSNYETLTATGLNDPEEEFKGRYERLGLTGLLFEELWTDE